MSPIGHVYNRVPAVYKVGQPAFFLSYSLRNTRFFMREAQRHASCLPAVGWSAHGAMHFGGTLWGTFRHARSPDPFESTPSAIDRSPGQIRARRESRGSFGIWPDHLSGIDAVEPRKRGFFLEIAFVSR
jgi:hypothetical protein